jgi:hypothetical protein
MAHKEPLSLPTFKNVESFFGGCGAAGEEPLWLSERAMEKNKNQKIPGSLPIQGNFLKVLFPARNS